MNAAWMEAVSVLDRADGFLVLGSQECLQVGDLVKDRFGCEVWYRVLGEANREEAKRQLEILNKHYGTVFTEPEPPPYFYKTVMVTH